MSSNGARCELAICPSRALVIPSSTVLDDDYVDMIEYKTLDGEIKYLSAEDLDYQNQTNLQELDVLLEQLNKYSNELKSGTPDFGLDDSSKKVDNESDSLVSTDSDASLKKGYFCKGKVHRLKMNLVRTAVIVGVALGLTASSKSSLDLGSVNYNSHSISIEKETEVVTNNLENLIEKSITSKIVKKDKERLGVIKLEDTKLASTSMSDGPSVNTKLLKCDSYKAHYAAILDDSNNLIDVIDVSKKRKMSINRFKKNCKKVYGNNISIQLNVDGVVDGKVLYEKAGWVSIEKSVSYNEKTSTKHI